MLKFHELSISPNNTKIRMALRFKEIPFEAVEVNPFDRASLIELSGQEGTPVIEDKGVVMTDSEAILQYLDANYRDAKRLYPSSKQDRRTCDAWKAELDQKIAGPWMPVFFHALGMRPELDADALKKFCEGMRWLDGEIGDQEHARGADKPICDLRVAEWATYAFPGPRLIERLPLFARMGEVFGLSAGDFPNVTRLIAPWDERLA